MSDRPAYVPITEAMFRAMRRLDPVQVADLMDMIYVYAFDGDEPNSDGVAAAVFEVVRPGIDKAFDSLRKKREAGRSRRSAQSPASTSEQTPAEPSRTDQNGADASKTEQTRADASTSEQNGQIKVEVKSNTPPPKRGEGGSRGDEPPSSPAPKRFTPPSVAEVAEYGEQFCRERGIPPGSFDAESFVDYWRSVGWRRGRTPMKDWRATARNWIKRDNPSSGKEADDGLFDRYDFDA